VESIIHQLHHAERFFLFSSSFVLPGGKLFLSLSFYLLHGQQHGHNSTSANFPCGVDGNETTKNGG